jgi:hypothetical protein
MDCFTGRIQPVQLDHSRPVPRNWYFGHVRGSHMQGGFVFALVGVRMTLKLQDGPCGTASPQ